MVCKGITCIIRFYIVLTVVMKHNKSFLQYCDVPFDLSVKDYQKKKRKKRNEGRVVSSMHQLLIGI